MHGVAVWSLGFEPDAPDLTQRIDRCRLLLRKHTEKIGWFMLVLNHPAFNIMNVSKHRQPGIWDPFESARRSR